MNMQGKKVGKPMPTVQGMGVAGVNQARQTEVISSPLNLDRPVKTHQTGHSGSNLSSEQNGSVRDRRPSDAAGSGLMGYPHFAKGTSSISEKRSGRKVS